VPLPETDSRIGSRVRSFESWIGTRSSGLALFVLAVAVFALQSVFLPAYPGRDMSRYLQAFFQLGDRVPIYPAVLNTRGPLSALGVAAPLELGGWAAEVWLALLYALSIVAWAKVAHAFGPRAAIATSVLLLVHPGYAILFHQLASDSLFAATFAVWVVLLTAAVRRPSRTAFALAGAGMGVLVLVRPGNQVLIVMALLPLVLRAPWRERLEWVAAFFIPAVVIAQSWRVFADLRWHDAVTLRPSTGLFALALLLVPFLLPRQWLRPALAVVAVLVVVGVAVKGVPGASPGQYARSFVRNESNQFLYRSFELDRIMLPDNGPASRHLAGVVERKLLTREPYRSYGVDTHEFFASGSDRIFGDLTWAASPADLSAATREAISTHPGTFASSIGHTFWDQLANRPVYAPENASASTVQSKSSASKQSYVVVNGKRLPKPSEGQPIPASAIGPLLWTPGGKAQEVWTSPTEHRFVFSNPRDERRYDELNTDVAHLAGRVPTREGVQSVVHRWNQVSHRYPPLVAWLLIGAVGLAYRRPRNAPALIAPCLAGLVVIVASALVVPAVPEYAAPVAPAFIVLAAVGVFGVPAARRTSWAELAGAAAGLTAAGWGLKSYYDILRPYFDGVGAPHDLAVFLGAAHKVVHAASPYLFNGDSTFAYPPFVAWLLAPLLAFSGSTAAIVWTLLSLVFAGLALWLLELRDWRCYAFAFVFLFTRSSTHLGTIEPLLLLSVAAAWHWRDRVGPAAAAVGSAVAFKLFLWPLAVWFALTRRLRTAALALVVAVGLVLVAWAAIGFAGVGDYPGVLRRLANEESTSSYSVVALGVRAHLPLAAARVVAVLVVVGLLAAAAFVARDERRGAHDRDVATLTLALAAAFAASPIVWVHYFLLLLVPLALTRPRLSLLWFVPFAFQPLGEAAWPAGNARNLGLALAATLLIGGAAVLPAQWRPSPARRQQLRLSPWR
jgi:Glycosyltransferase family 87/Dolichyl-phosphate-mannose-protein mannosyltransferase